MLFGDWCTNSSGYVSSDDDDSCCDKTNMGNYLARASEDDLVSKKEQCQDVQDAEDYAVEVLATEATHLVIESVVDGNNKPKVQGTRSCSVRRPLSKVYMTRARAASLVKRTRLGNMRAMNLYCVETTM